MTGADAEYLRRKRAAEPDYKETNLKAMRARGRAETVLSHRYPEEFLEILNAERAKEGMRALTPETRIGRPKVKHGEGE